jgi:hypothetical protein
LSVLGERPHPLLRITKKRRLLRELPPCEGQRSLKQPKVSGPFTRRL